MTGAGPEQPDDTDAALLAAHVDGDPDAFGRLVVRHRDRLWAVALRTTGNPEDAADALQDALVSAFRRADGFRGDSAVTTWLHRVVVNACLDRLRRVKVRAADPLPEDLDRHLARHVDRGTGPGAGPAPVAEDPERSLERSEVRGRVHAALRLLPDDQRAAVVLVDLEGLPVAEAAAVLDVPTGTVKSRCSRGRARLAEHLADLLDASPAPGAGTVDGPAASHPERPAPGRTPSRPDHPTPPRR